MQVRLVRILLFAIVLLSMSAPSFAAIGVLVSFGPPPLPVYEQPICPGDGYLWTPGYWAYDDGFDDYYWVPGTWVLAPEVGFLWTPGYWGWGGSGFVFYDGYWGPHIGFYGGINYGFGYWGTGFFGGEWRGGSFFYNTAVLHVDNVHITNVYVNRTVIVNNESHVAFNGGQGGVTVRPTPQEEANGHERHIPPVAAQTQHLQEARNNPQQRASVNMGKPAVAATARPGDFKGGAVAAREAGGRYEPPASHSGNTARSTAPGHVRELPPAEKPAPPNTGDPKLDQKYQKQQSKLYANQDKERQKVAQQQEKEDQRVAKQNDDAAKQQLEQRHQQQTQQLQQKHQQQQQQMQQRIQAAPRPARPPK